MNVEPEKIHALINILQSMLVVDDSNTEEETVEKVKVSEKKTKRRTNSNIKNQKPKKVFVNKFDKMAERSMHKDDILIDKQLNILPPTPRDRHFEPVNVQCRICGKSETVSPSLIDSQNRYKCNNCCTNAG